MTYNKIVGQSAKAYAASIPLAFCFISFLFSSLYFICYADSDEDPFKSKRFQKLNERGGSEEETATKEIIENKSQDGIKINPTKIAMKHYKLK